MNWKKRKTNLKVNIEAKTNGRGFWCLAENKPMKIHTLELDYVDVYDNGFVGELRAYFTKKSWNIETKGLAYTDPQWMRDFSAGLKKLGFSPDAIRDVCYSEQGMQGEDYVSMDFGHIFFVEWLGKGLFFNGEVG